MASISDRGRLMVRTAVILSLVMVGILGCAKSLPIKLICMPTVIQGHNLLYCASPEEFGIQEKKDDVREST